MRFLVYCQHVLGIGHLVRTYEILQHLTGHRVVLVLGGPRADLPPPPHVEVVQLPGLRMDAAFSGLLPVDPGSSLDRIKQQRTRRLLELFAAIRPDILLIELFPFGRNSFRFELEPLLDQAGKNHNCQVVCSVRDILVERDNTQKFEQRVIDRLNRWFDLLLVHSDPEVIRLDATFSRVTDISIPVCYTGYIGQQHIPPLAAAESPVAQSPDQPLIVASAGSGSVGYTLLNAVLKAHRQLSPPCRLQVFTGPYLEDQQFTLLRETAGPGAQVCRFTSSLPQWLGAAQLSVSMGGYNTTMNILAAGCPALIFPFQQNHEQGLRARKLSSCAPIELLTPGDLQPQILAGRMAAMMSCKKIPSRVRLDGAAVTRTQLTCQGNLADDETRPSRNPTDTEHNAS